MYSYGRGVVGNPEPLSIVGPLGATVGVLWFWSMNVVRISMCLMILRLKDSRRWKGPLWSLIAVQVALALSATAVNLCYCRPLSAAWESDPDAVCLKPSQMEAFAYTYNGEYKRETPILCSSVIPSSLQHRFRLDSFIDASRLYIQNASTDKRENSHRLSHGGRPFSLRLRGTKARHSFGEIWSKYSLDAGKDGPAVWIGVDGCHPRCLIALSQSTNTSSLAPPWFPSLVHYRRFFE